MTQGYFENEKDVGNVDFLSKSAVEAGVFATEPEVSIHIPLEAFVLFIFGWSHRSLLTHISSCLPSFVRLYQVATFLSTKLLVPEITKAYARAQSLGITGVPFTVIDGKYGVSGAQESETFAQVSRPLRPLLSASLVESSFGGLLTSFG